MCKILPRLKALADNEGITITALERSIGASKGVISRAISNGTDIQSKWLQAIVENYPQYSAQWLLTGIGDMLTPPPIAYARSQEHIIKNIKPGENAFTDLIYPTEATPKALPLVSVKAVGGFAGKDFSINEQDIESYYVIPKFRNLDVDFLIEVIGDSMMPRLFPGDIIACSVIRNPNFIQWNKTYLIATDEQGMIVKRLKKSSEKGNLLAVSDNVDYDPFDIPMSDIKGLARVVGVIHAD